MTANTTTRTHDPDGDPIEEPCPGDGDKWPERCAYCQGAHHVQACDVLRTAVRGNLLMRPHTIADIPALLRLAYDIRHEGGNPARMLGIIHVLCEEYVLSDHICRCGGQLDSGGQCPRCIDMRAVRARCAETARSDWLVS